MAKEKLQGRIRYAENYNNDGEHFIFESKWSNEPETAWGLDTAFKLHPYKDRDGELISYQALTKIREWQKLGLEFWFV